MTRPTTGILAIMVKRLKRPRDPVSLAKLIGDIATGQVVESPPEEPSAAQVFARSGGLKGGKARAKSLTAKQRKDIATRAARARWSK